jgi:sensor histidine kinase regulating citrate/malate metabolism
VLNFADNIVNGFALLFMKNTLYDTPLVLPGETLVVLLATLPTFALKEKGLKNQLEVLSKKDYALIAVVLVMDFILSSISPVFLIKDKAKGRNIIGVAMLIVAVMSLYLLILYVRIKNYEYALLLRNEENQKLLDMEVEHYKELQKKNMDLRKFRHDYYAHIHAMEGLAENEDWNGLREYLSALCDIKEQTRYISVHHPVADAILNYFYERLPEDTKVYVQGSFPKQSGIKDSDLCILLSNLLKNAVEAMEYVTQTEKKIYFSVFSDENTIHFRVENTSRPYSEEEIKHLTTSKQDTLNHGLGLKNVKDVLTQYAGQMAAGYRDGMFCADVVLKVDGNEKH